MRPGSPDDWYRVRRYAHFDRPLSKVAAERLAESPLAVTSHAFWPVILNPHRVLSSKVGADGRRRRVVKRRPIAMCAHSDAHIYAFYAWWLCQLLEQVYLAEGGEHVLAYRKHDPPQCNVHFAMSAFNELTENAPCEFVAMDVEGFFDVLDHGHLKAAWCQLLGTPRLPDDHFAIYKACTRDYAITIPRLRDLLGGEVRRRAGKQRAAICSPERFRSTIKPELRPRHELVWEVKRKSKPQLASDGPAGIPQGLPISAVLANVYMLEVDRTLRRKTAELGGTYRRYSDDILVIVPPGKGHQAEEMVQNELAQVRLTINAKKTERRKTTKRLGRARSVAADANWSELGLAPASYLGLVFDGENVSLRPSTVSAFEIKAKRAIKRAELAAERNEHPRIKRRQLYAKLTSMGYGGAYGKGAMQGDPPPGAPRLGFFRYLKLVQRVTESASVATQANQIERRIRAAIDAADRRIRLRAAQKR